MAKEGNAEAQYILAMLYLKEATEIAEENEFEHKTNPRARELYTQHTKWKKEALDQNYAPAQVYEGYQQYTKKFIVPEPSLQEQKDGLQKGAELFLKAAKQGDRRGQFLRAIAVAEDDNTSNDIEGYAWMLLAWKQGLRKYPYRPEIPTKPFLDSYKESLSESDRKEALLLSAEYKTFYSK